MPDHFYVYPAYLGKGRSRSEGRRVGASESVPELTAQEILDAAKRLGYTAVIEADKDYPRDAGSYGGRVKVTKRSGTTKAKFLRLLSADLRAHPPAGGGTH
jgi:signal recognition particle subunit SEC65